MTSPFAYVPRPGPLQSASPAAAIAYVGSLAAVAFLYSSPLVLAAAGLGAYLAGRLAGARGAVRAALRMSIALALLIVVVNALVVDRGETVLLRLGDWPLFGQVDVTAEALASGAVIGLRAAVTMIAFAVYSACVDPDRVLRSLRPDRRPLGPDRGADLAPGPGRGGRREPAPRRRPPARPGRRPARPRHDRAPPPRRLPGPRRRRRGDPGAARLLPAGAGRGAGRCPRSAGSGHAPNGAPLLP